MKKLLVNLKLVTKILLCVMIPLGVTMLVSGISIANICSSMGKQLEEVQKALEDIEAQITKKSEQIAETGDELAVGNAFCYTAGYALYE